MINPHTINTFGEKIKKLNEKKELNQEELSFQTNLHRNGRKRNISLSNIGVFVKVLKISISELLKLESTTYGLDFSKYKLKAELKYQISPT